MVLLLDFLVGDFLEVDLTSEDLVVDCLEGDLLLVLEEVVDLVFFIGEMFVVGGGGFAADDAAVAAAVVLLVAAAILSVDADVLFSMVC